MGGRHQGVGGDGEGPPQEVEAHQLGVEDWLLYELFKLKPRCGESEVHRAFNICLEAAP